jgi:hypothetical protein
MKAARYALATAAVFASTLGMPAIAQDRWRATSLVQFDGTTGYSPSAGVITDRRGTVFGTTSIGGDGPCLGGAGCGTVFALSPPTGGGGAWVFNKIYDFQGGQDGSAPSAPLTLSSDGIVYGYSTGSTFGTVFRILPPENAGSSWTFQILYVFTAGGATGNLEAIYSPLLLRGGALYGIAAGGSSACGQFGCGSVFRLTPGPGGGAWMLETVFRFAAGGGSGEPNSIVGPNDAGPLYISTSWAHGAVVEISQSTPSGVGIERVITRFQGGDGGRDPTNLVLAPDGSLFGLAVGRNTGLVFHLTPPTAAAQPWTRTTIAAISEHQYGPVSLAVGDSDSLIGAVEGDFDFFAGSVIELTPPSTGVTWNYTELWNFNHGPDRNPLNVVRGLRGNLFTVMQGGDSTSGSLIELHRP